MNRKCRICSVVKKIKEFKRDNTCRLGRTNSCLECYRNQCNKRYHEIKNDPGFKKKRSLRYAEDYKKRDKKKTYARFLVNAQKRKNNIVPAPCIICGHNKTEAHHPNYNKPLLIVWLCPEHHRQVHRKELKI